METKAMGTGNILVVEDEPSIARICMRTLTAEGYKVETVVNGKIARSRLGKEEYDLYIVDVRTPEMNGMELYEEMSKPKFGLANKVLFTTGDVLSHNIKDFLEESGRPCLPKPFTPDELRGVVNTLLRH
jgi:DNA-binding response OmpR family regulator